MSKIIHCKRSKYFPFCNFEKKSQIGFLKEKKKNTFCFGSFFLKIILLESWNLPMSLIRCWAMTGYFQIFESKCISSYAFPGMEYQETSVSFTFLTNHHLGKKNNFAFLSSFQQTHIPMFSGYHLMPKTTGSEVNTWSWKQKLVGVSRTGGIS